MLSEVYRFSWWPRDVDLQRNWVQHQGTKTTYDNYYNKSFSWSYEGGSEFHRGHNTQQSYTYCEGKENWYSSVDG